MADNTTLPGTGDVIADEDISGVKYQLVKLINPTAAERRAFVDLIATEMVRKKAGL